MKHEAVGFAAAVLLALAGCSVEELPQPGQGKLPAALEQALLEGENFELYSLNPDIEKFFPDSAPPPPEDHTPRFHGWEVLGSITIDDANVQKRIVTALQAGITEFPDGLGFPACFNPRHGIRVSYGGTNYDLVICFQCDRIELHGPMQERILPVNDLPQPTLDEILAAANVPLPQ